MDTPFSTAPIPMSSSVPLLELGLIAGAITCGMLIRSWCIRRTLYPPELRWPKPKRRGTGRR